MTLLAPGDPAWVRVIHPDVVDDPDATEAYVPAGAYRTVWYDAGWRSPLDDPSYSGTFDVVDAGPAAPVPDLIDADGAAADVITGGSA